MEKWHAYDKRNDGADDAALSDSSTKGVARRIDTCLVDGLGIELGLELGDVSTFVAEGSVVTVDIQMRPLGTEGAEHSAGAITRPRLTSSSVDVDDRRSLPQSAGISPA